MQIGTDGGPFVFTRRESALSSNSIGFPLDAPHRAAAFITRYAIARHRRNWRVKGLGVIALTGTFFLLTARKVSIRRIIITRVRQKSAFPVFSGRAIRRRAPAICNPGNDVVTLFARPMKSEIYACVHVEYSMTRNNVTRKKQFRFVVCYRNCFALVTKYKWIQETFLYKSSSFSFFKISQFY